MNCPVCENTRMREVEKNGVIIDICPDCKGVWLDRGELDKLLQKVNEGYSAYEPNPTPPPSSTPYPPKYDSYNKGHYPHYPPYKHKKKHTIFDFFDDLF